jgi:hypothetical protein
VRARTRVQPRTQLAQANSSQMGTVHQGFCKLHGEDATKARAGGAGGAAEALARFLELPSWDTRVQQHDLGHAARQGRAASPKLRCFPWFQV